MKAAEASEGNDGQQGIRSKGVQNWCSGPTEAVPPRAAARLLQGAAPPR